MLWPFRHMLLIYYDLLPINVLSICCRCAFGFNLNFNRRSTMISIRYNSSLRHRNRNYESLINGPAKWYQYAYQCRIICYRFALARPARQCYIYINVCVYIYICVHICIRTCINVCTCTSICICMGLSVGTGTSTSAGMNINMSGYNCVTVCVSVCYQYVANTV